VDLKATIAAFKALNEKLQKEPLSDEERRRWRAMKAEIVAAANAGEPLQSVANRREHPRAPLRLQAAFHSAAQFARAYTTTLSGGGVSVLTELACPVGAMVQLDLTLPGHEKPVTVNGRAVWVKGRDPCEVGVRFDGVPTRIEELFDALVMESIAWELEGRG
jgi:uncharacterized protein (TIGR02266 family)